jgi:hypothetical protein
MGARAVSLVFELARLASLKNTLFHICIASSACLYRRIHRALSSTKKGIMMEEFKAYGAGTNNIAT